MSSAWQGTNVPTLSHTQALVQSKDWKTVFKPSGTRLEGQARRKPSCKPTVHLFFTSFGGFLNEANCAGMPYKTSPLPSF